MPSPVTDVDRAAIERAAAAHHATLYTRPVLDQAAALLADMYATADRHGIRRDSWAGVTNLPDACLSVAAERIERRHITDPQTAADLLDQAAAELRDRGIPARRQGWQVTLPRQTGTGRALALSIGAQTGAWSLHPPSGGRAAYVVAGTASADVRAVADLLADYLAGRHPVDPFRSA